METVLRTRKEKISFLNGLLAGTRQIEEIQDQTPVIWWELPDANFKGSGLYKGPGGQIISEIEILELQKLKHIIIVRPSGDKPIKDEDIWP